MEVSLFDFPKFKESDEALEKLSLFPLSRVGFSFFISHER